MVTNISGGHAHSAKNISVNNGDTANRHLPINMATSPSRFGGLGAQEVDADEGAPVVRGGVAPRVMASDTAECMTPALQPAPGQFSIQVRHVLYVYIRRQGQMLASRDRKDRKP